MTGPLHRARQWLGVLTRDWPRWRRALASPGRDYLALCNRAERLEPAPDGSGYRCLWPWTSDLHAPKLMPGLGRTLMSRSLADHPLRRAGSLPAAAAAPELTFLIGHRGMERLPLLLATLESIAGQEGASVDCVVVEQDEHARIAPHLPPWVRHVHTPPPHPGMAYCRSWAFNVGARQGGAPVVVLHDNDMLVPSDYAASILALTRQGHEVVNLKRFIFYLDEGHTRAVLAGTAALTAHAPQAIVQNLEAGGSVAITREAFARIGGMDESFIGWGGEDNEFWERAQALRVWPWAHLPIVHLWHAAQPGKLAGSNQALAHYRDRTLIPVAQRIEQLRHAPSGEMAGPAMSRPSRPATGSTGH